MRRFCTLLAVVVPLVAPACAARSNRDQVAALQAQADDLVRQGCYDCLLEARDVYARAAASPAAPMTLRRIEVELLLALREKELGIDPSQTLERARRLTAGAGSGADMGRSVALVEAVPPDRVGTPSRMRLLSPLTSGREGLEAAIAAIAASPFAAPFRAYFEAAVQCGRPPLASAPATGRSESDAPLVVYRRAICDPIDTKSLEQVRAAVPRFVETSLFMGRAAIGTLFENDGSRARQHLEDAYQRFAHSPVVTFHLATVMQATGDCRSGERYFTETLAIYDDHEEARLGRAICRTYLSNADGAVDDATVLIDAAAPNRGDAYYWRAWNRRAQKQIDRARADIDEARALRYNARVLTLAGMIEHDQGEFIAAREDLERASELDSSECQARWYLGLVGYATEEWRAAAAGFAEAADCYGRLVADNMRRKEEMSGRENVSEEFRRRQIAGFDAAIAEDRTQQSAADLNAAINYARAGDVDRATTFMKRAWVDPERRSVVEDLRQVLGVPRW
jgi:tetratricopeptide (TPR) repeat protein